MVPVGTDFRPFDGIPNEVLITILGWVLDMVDRDDDPEERSRMPHRLSAVSQRWFKVATSSPELWCLAYLNLKHLKQPERTRERIDVLLDRAANRSVHFHVNFASEYQDPNENFPGNPFILDSALRVGKITLIGLAPAPFHALTGLFPRLEEVSISPRLGLPVWSLKFHAPNLHRLYCSAILPRVGPSALSSLRHLDLNKFPALAAARLAAFLDRCPDLETLNIRHFVLNVGGDLDEDAFAVPTIILHQLKTLEMVNVGAADVRGVLTLLDAPSLEELLLKNVKTSKHCGLGFSVGFWDQFPVRPLPGLRRLRLHCAETEQTRALALAIAKVAPSITDMKVFGDALSE